MGGIVRCRPRKWTGRWAHSCSHGRTMAGRARRRSSSSSPSVVEGAHFGWVESQAVHVKKARQVQGRQKTAQWWAWQQAWNWWAKGVLGRPLWCWCWGGRMGRSCSASPVQTRDQRRMHQRQWQWHRAVSHKCISHSGQYKMQQNSARTRRVQLRGPEARQQRSGDISKQNKCMQQRVASRIQRPWDRQVQAGWYLPMEPFSFSQRTRPPGITHSSRRL